ncbi:hypothetical protein Tco_0541453 [Tanacetum coccineum]
MTRSTTKKLTKPLDEPEREFHRPRRAAWRQQQNESLAIVGRNSSITKRLLLITLELNHYSLPKPYGNTLFLVLPATTNPLKALFPGLDQTGPPPWDTKMALGCLKRACMQISYLEASHREIELRKPYLICDIYGGAYKADKCDQNNPTKQVCLSGRDIYDDPSLLRFCPNDDVPRYFRAIIS